MQQFSFLLVGDNKFMILNNFHNLLRSKIFESYKEGYKLKRKTWQA